MRTSIQFPPPINESEHLTSGFRLARFSRHRLVFAVLAFASLGSAQPGFSQVYATAEEAARDPDFGIQGEYLGSIIFGGESEPTRVGIQLAARGKDKFEGLIYPGGLPGCGWAAKDGGRQTIIAERTGDHVQTEPLRSVIFRHEEGKLIGRDEQGAKRGVLERITRTSATEGKAAPEEAIVLFDGSGIGKWRDGAQIVAGGHLGSGARSTDHYGDMYLHLEFKPGFMPAASGEGRTNSGVYIQGRYEVQILDSFGMSDNRSMNAAIYREKAPKLNMSFPPLQWQTYDIFFRAPRFDEEGGKTENTRITVFHNGVLIHDDVELKGGTGQGGRLEEVPKEHLFLQNHTGPVSFRNVWLIEDFTVAQAALTKLKSGTNPADDPAR